MRMAPEDQIVVVEPPGASVGDTMTAIESIEHRDSVGGTAAYHRISREGAAEKGAGYEKRAHRSWSAQTCRERTSEKSDKSEKRIFVTEKSGKESKQ